MSAKLNKSVQGLEKGQLWKMHGAHIQILCMGKTSVDYKMLMDFALTGMRQTTSIKAMEVYLTNHTAQLINANC